MGSYVRGTSVQDAYKEPDRPPATCYVPHAGDAGDATRRDRRWFWGARSLDRHPQPRARCRDDRRGAADGTASVAATHGTRGTAVTHGDPQVVREKCALAAFFVDARLVPQTIHSAFVWRTTCMALSC